MFLAKRMNKALEIKICGITDKFCMDAALESEVDYIGLVYFKKSPRKSNRFP